MAKKDTNIFAYNIIQCFFYKTTYATSVTVVLTTRNQIMITGETKSGIMRILINFTDPYEIKEQ